ncbi:MAG: outer rane adhesin like protein, partial [Proteobacteria bacterium]|nr:outer rane adhesin like protein [Pseudomonadota bacterium]
SLNAGDTISDTFSVASVDGTLSSVQVTIIGTNDGPMAESKVFTTAEDTAITITDAQLLANATDIDSHDILSVNNVTLVDNANGSLINNHDGTYTFIPSANYSGSDIELIFTVTDSSGLTDTQDVTINVTPVADAPLLDVSVSQGDVIISPEYPAPIFNGHLNAGSTTGNIVFEGYTKTAAIDIKSYKTNVDDGRIVFLRDGIVVKEVLIDTLLPDANNTPVHLELSADEYFNTVRIDNFATSSDKNAEFKIDSVSLIADIAVEYNINIAAALTDSSETLGQVLIDQSTLPMDATLFENGVIQSATDGYYSVDPDATVTFTTDHYMSVDEINAITSSVTSWDDADYATTMQTALNEITGTSSDDGLYGSTGDDLMDGDSGNDALYGDSGDDTLDGGIGTDSLYGGADNDTLTYDSNDNMADGGSGTDTLLIQDSTMDFSGIDDAKIENIEVLDLSKSDVSISNLNPNDVFDMTDDANTILRIVGDSSDSVASTIVADESPWAVLADQTGVDDGFTRYEGTLDDGVTKVMVDIQDTIVHTDFD